MKKSYITSEALPEIVSEIMSDFIESNRHHVTISFGTYGDTKTLEVRVQDSMQSFKTIFNKDYTVVEEPIDSYCLTSDIGDAVEQAEKDVPSKIEEA